MKKNQTSSDSAVIVKDIYKSFKLPHENHAGMKQLVVDLFRKDKNKGYEVQQVLKGVSFEVKKGDFFGIVGRNGSGKSTLLKLLAGIYEPEAGKITTNGSVVPFIELGVGFNPELTGRENIFLNGALLGFSRDEMKLMYDEIVEFAELERFMDQKLKNYSSGMQVRLAFSIAIQARGDILILDEVLAVGDEAFQRKCDAFFEQIKKDKSKTVILVTHSMDAVRKYCNQAILIRDGMVITEGSPDKVANEYSIENIQDSNKHERIVDEVDVIKNTPIITANIVSSPILKNTETLEVDLVYKNINKRSVYPKLVLNYSGVPIMAANGKVLYGITTDDTDEHSVRYKLPLKDFNKGEVNIAALLVDSEREVNLANFGYNNELQFVIKNDKTGDKIGGIMRDLGKMDIKK